jgi:dUTP pyrophosphatase
VLHVKQFHPEAKLPTVGNPGEDIGYDLYAVETVIIRPGAMKQIHTGISIEFVPSSGSIIATKSGHAKQGALVVGGIIDAGYRGELVVLMRNLHDTCPLRINAGEKCAQLLRYPFMAGPVCAIPDGVEHTASTRGERGFGSTGLL